MVSVGVIGSGAWGTTLALLLANKGIHTTLWEHHPERASVMQEQRENRLFLQGFRFPRNPAGHSRYRSSYARSRSAPVGDSFTEFT